MKVKNKELHQHQQAIINLLTHLQSQTSSPASRCSIVGDLANHVCLFCCNAMRSLENIDFASQVNEVEGAPRKISQTPPLPLPNNEHPCMHFALNLCRGPSGRNKLGK